MVDDELKYKKLRESLRHLPRIKAKGDFEARLFRRIRDEESRRKAHYIHEPEKKSSIIDVLANLLRPSFVPAVALTVVLLITVVVYFAYFDVLKKDTIPPTGSKDNEKKGEFVIYVHKDGQRVEDETARDITSTGLSERKYSPTEHSSSDFSSQPVEMPKPEMERSIDDRLSKEQEHKMEKEATPKIETEEIMTEPKKDEGIMKKSGKIEDSNEAPYNVRKEYEDTSGKDKEGYMEEQKLNEPDQINQQVDGKNKAEEKERISRNKKDSLKAKEKKVEEQKDSIEK